MSTVTCIACRKSYQVFTNENYGKDPYELKYRNEDANGVYLSNDIHKRCPSCVLCIRPEQKK